MATLLSNWEEDFAEAIQRIKPAERSKPGALLPLIPDHSRWNDFVASVKAEWRNWKNDLWQHPACLVLFYCGLAFYEYDDNTFWPQFAKSIGSEPLPPNQQNEINIAFAKAARHFGFQLKNRDNGTDFVGSAVQYVGIPLSLWDGFLDVCEWALWRKDWNVLATEEWIEAVHKRSGGRRRLRRFLIDNRISANTFVQEILDVREILTTDPGLTITSLAQASILRVEYFDEVPETAEFLRPQNPDSLFQDRARLIWNEQRRRVCLQLPAVKREKLPATWRVGRHSQNAAPSPDVLTMDSDAFCDPIFLTLESRSQSATQRLRGLGPWGLFDTENGGQLVNSNRDELPLRSYILISQKEIEILSREGFDEDGNPVNDRFELADGTTCFVSRLWPTGKYAELRLKDDSHGPKTIRFRPRSKIEANFLIGWGRKAAYYVRTAEGKIEIDHLPILCVAIPGGYFRDDDAELAQNFRVQVDGKSAAGGWERGDVHATSGRSFFYWKWSKRPFIERKPGVSKLTSLKQLGDAFKSPDLRGDRIISVDAIPHIRAEFKVRIIARAGEDIDRCWEGLPGAFLPMFLLCQPPDGLKWEEILLAKDVIAPDLSFTPRILHKYAYHGFLMQRGHRWLIKDSRAELTPIDRDWCRLNYCGDPSILWGLYRRMSHHMQAGELPVIDVIDKRGEVPYLQMSWPLRLRSELERSLRHRRVVMGAILWSH